MKKRLESVEAVTRAALHALRDADVPHMLVGAVAAGVWGTPRFTADADFVVAADPGSFDDMLAVFARRGFHAPAGLKALWRTHGSIRLPYRRDPVLFHIDLLSAASDFDREALRRSSRRRLFGMPVRVATAEDVILYKIIARRPQDWLDIAGIVRRQGRRLDTRHLKRWARWLAGTYPAFAHTEKELATALLPLKMRCS